MFTRCEHCQAALPISPVDLAQAGGMVRCGSCGRTINALAALFAEAPDGTSTPIRSNGMPPLISPRVEQEQMLAAEAAQPPVSPLDFDEASSRDAPAGLDLDLSPSDSPQRWARILWPALGAVLLLVLIIQLVGPAAWRVDPATLGLGEAAPIDIGEAIQLVSRDLHRHPTLSDAVVISSVLVNRSGQPVAWPTIELKLFDASQQVIGQRMLAPSDYLDADADLARGFAPDVRLPVVLEMVVEGSYPSGFSMAFY